MERVKLHPLFYSSMEQAIPLGLLLTLMTGALLFCQQVPALSILLLVSPVFVVWLLVRGLAKVASQHTVYCTFAPLWMSGIVQFICASLISALITGVFLSLSHGFLNDFFMNAFDTMQQGGKGSVQVMEGVSRTKFQSLVPSVMQFVFAIFWTSTFFGSILSLICGLALPMSGWFRRLCNKMSEKRNDR